MSTVRPTEATPGPWHQACTLREDIRTGSLDLAEFAADLQSVRKGNAAAVYGKPEQFFPRTYPTHSLRTLVRDVLLRLAGQEGRPVVRLQVAYGGGKTHALLTLLHLAEHGHGLSADTTVRQFLDFAGLPQAPVARVAILPFDQFDVHHGLLTFAPDGRSRHCRTPWGALAYQLGGDAGFARVAKHEEEYVSPAEPVLAELLGMPAAQGRSTLVLVDEAVWYGNEATKQDGRRLGVLRDFFQALTQAVTRQPRTALVATLVSSDVYAHDATALTVLQAFEGVFGRLTDTAEPVGRGDWPEILRRRLFEIIAPPGIQQAATDAFFAQLHQLPVREAQRAQAAYDRMLASYPFHADLLDVLYQKWSQLPGAGFQRTRGALRLMAYALRDAEKKDPAAWIGPGALLGAGTTPSPALTELTTFTSDRDRWGPILGGELGRALEIEADHPTLRSREVQQAVVATFLHSQPEGQSAAPADLWALVAHPHLDRAALEEGLRIWRSRSWFLTEDEAVWRLGTNPNLTAMHLRAMERVLPSAVEAELRKRIGSVETLVGVDPGVNLHVLPQSPGDVKPDSPAFRYIVLGPEAATSAGTQPAKEVTAFWTEVLPGNPRTYRNGLLAVAPDPARLAGLHEQVRGLLAWRKMPADPDFVKAATEAQKVQVRKNGDQAEKDLPGAILATYSVVLRPEPNGPGVVAHALPSGNDRPFDRVKALLQSEDGLIVREVDPAELLPAGGLNLWAEQETAKTVTSLIGAFYQFRRLPPLLRPELIEGSLRHGVQAGLFCLRNQRPDGTSEVFWRSEPTEEQMRRPGSEVVLLQHAVLERLRPQLLSPGALPGLWAGPNGPTVGRLRAFFGGEHAPRLREGALDAAISDAVREGLVALEVEGRTYLAEPLPEGGVPPESVLTIAPEPVSPEAILPGALPAGWPSGMVTDLAKVATAVAAARKAPVPWSLVVKAVDAAISRGLLQLEPGSELLPGSPQTGATIRIGLPVVTTLAPSELIASATQSAWKGGRAQVAAIHTALEAGGRRIPLEVLHAGVQAALKQRLAALGPGATIPEKPGPDILQVVLQRQPKVHAMDGALTAKQIQSLANVWPDVQRTLPKAELECVCTVTIRGDIPEEVAAKLNALLAQVRDDWGLRSGS